MTTGPVDRTRPLKPASDTTSVQQRTVIGGDFRSFLTLLPMLFVSLGFHVGLALALFVGTFAWGWLFPGKPLIEEQTIEVSMVVLPHTDSAMPDRAMRAPRPAGEDAPAPTPDPSVKESDLQFQTDQPKPSPKGDPNADQSRAQQMADLERKRLMEDLSAPTGEYDQDATDPNSTSNLAINTGAAGAATDPEYAKYIVQLQQLFMQHFRPLPGIAQATPHIRATVFIEVDPATGKVIRYAFKKNSGNDAYDRAAELAVQSVPTIPLPPEKYRDLAKQGYEINFDPPR